MKTNYVLVDYENVQPKDVALLIGGPFKVKIKVFLGPSQAKVPVSLAAALQGLGSDAEYVVIETGAKNALDFHIAYYIGRLACEEPSAHFHIISKDTGFDPLIKYLETIEITAQRSPAIADIPCFKPAVLPTTDEGRIHAAIADLSRRKAAKPGSEKTLRSTLHALFKKELSEQDLTALLAALIQRGIVKVEDTKVSYNLPPDAQVPVSRTLISADVSTALRSVE